MSSDLEVAAKKMKVIEKGEPLTPDNDSLEIDFPMPDNVMESPIADGVFDAVSKFQLSTNILTSRVDSLLTSKRVTVHQGSVLSPYSSLWLLRHCHMTSGTAVIGNYYTQMT